MRNNKHYLDYKNRKWKLKQHTHEESERDRKKWGSETFFEWERLCFFNLLLGKIGALIISHDDDGWHGSAWLRYIWQKSRGAPFKKRFKTLFNKPFLLPISMVEMVSGSDWSWTPSSTHTNTSTSTKGIVRCGAIITTATMAYKCESVHLALTNYLCV